MARKTYALGLDFGTNSVRALVADVQTGREAGTGISEYKKGKQGIILDSQNTHVARQHPRDWINSMQEATKQALGQAGRNIKTFFPENIIGIGVDTTGSTPLPLDKKGKPLAEHPEFKNNLDAMAWLWKDHSAYAEAREITDLAQKIRPHYLDKCGGVYSSEWFFSKILHCLRKSPQVFRAAHTWAECSDYIPAVLTGRQAPETMPRNICAAGHKAMYNDMWGGLPDEKFLARLDPRMAELKARLYQKAVPVNKLAGLLTGQWAKRLGLPERTPVAVGAMDAHLGAVGAGIRPGTLVKIIGTSTCDMMVAGMRKEIPDIPGLCGIVPHSILPGYHGLEAGQSAVGDIFNWFVSCLSPCGMGHTELTRLAKKLKPGKSGLLALDWNNGNRTVLADHRLTGLIMGQTLHTRPEEIYRALIEATAFGAKIIINRFEEYGMKVNQVINCGGISEKNDLLLQIYADVIGRPMKIASSSQTCALGACMAAAAAAGTKNGGHPSLVAAQKAMGGTRDKVFHPIPENKKIYRRLFQLYRDLHDGFGGVGKTGFSKIMKELLDIKESI